MGRVSADAVPPRETRLPRAVWALGLVSFFADVSSEMAYPLLPLFLVGVLGAGRLDLGLVEGAAALLVAVTAAFAGVLSDRSGRRVGLIRWGYGLPVLGKTLVAVAGAWPVVLGGRLVDRLGKGLRGAPRDALLAEATPAALRGRAFGLHRALDTAGALVGVLVSALVLWLLTGAARAGDADAAAIAPGVYRALFAAAAVLGLASLALTFLVREPQAGRGDPATAKPSALPGLRVPPACRPVVALLTLFAFASSSDAFLLSRAGDAGLAAWQVVLLYASYNVAYAALSYPAGALSDRLGRFGAIGAGWVLHAGVYAGFAFLPERRPWAVWPLMTALGASLALTDGVGKALVADRTTREERASVLGLLRCTSGVATCAAGLVVGAVWDAAGPAPAFSVGAVVAGLAVALLPLAARQRAPI